MTRRNGRALNPEQRSELRTGWVIGRWLLVSQAAEYFDVNTGRVTEALRGVERSAELNDQATRLRGQHVQAALKARRSA